MGTDMDRGINDQKPLFAQLGRDGSSITFVCFDDGYGVFKDGALMPQCRWPTVLLDAALESFHRLVQLDDHSVRSAPRASKGSFI